MEPTVFTRAERAELHAVRVRRAELRESINGLERALAAPARDLAVDWGEVVHAALIALSGDFGAHVEVTEGPGGLHQSILAGDLRLANAVARLAEEHQKMAGVLAALVAASAAPVTPDDVADLREQSTRLLGLLVRHRQRGADLIYEAFATDIGGGD